MRLRQWISILAVFGVLLHAGAIVRHNAAMADASFQHQALVDSLTQICHGAGPGSVNPADLPYVPPPNDTQNGCPICSGLGSPVALCSPPAVAALVLAPATETFSPHAHRVPTAAHAVCPPARGPPLVA